MLWVSVAIIFLILPFAVFRSLPISPIIIALGMIVLIVGGFLAFPWDGSKNYKPFVITLLIGFSLVIIGILCDGVYMYHLLG